MSTLPLIRHDSRSRIGIDWYDDEAEADARVAHFKSPEYTQACADANIGIVQVGRDRGFDYTDENGVRLFAVVTP